MITGAVFGLSLVVLASVDTNIQSPLEPGDAAMGMSSGMSSQQRNAVMQRLVRNATECIMRAVAADPRLKVSTPPGDVNDLIVTSMTVCLAPVRAMIDTHDRLFGEGTGEAFFMGPYLDVLPAAVSKQVKGNLQ